MLTSELWMPECLVHSLVHVSVKTRIRCLALYILAMSRIISPPHPPPPHVPTALDDEYPHLQRWLAGSSASPMA